MIVQFAVAGYKKKCNEYFYLNDLFKGTVSTIPNDPLCKEVNAMFTHTSLYSTNTKRFYRVVLHELGIDLFA